uniref:Uncharacterized protein n=1 Tax=Nelumbo nucifera TaxID=4432 RepID=A0A822XJR2_NELNU|nr:TPA_asm: hypothetical protein HUJ06_021705 [Nelumbo nucifera]
MEIPEGLLKFKYHIISVTLSCLVVFSLFHVAPGFLTVLAYFQPLLLSTVMFLVVVAVFGRMETEAIGEKTGEGLLDYVARQPAGVE